MFQLFFNNGYSDEFNLDAKSLNILNKGDVIEASGDVEILTDTNLKIFSDKSTINKKKQLLVAEDNVKLIDQSNEIIVTSDFIKYEKLKELIFVKGYSETNFSKDYKIKTKNLYFDRKKMIVYSDEKTIIVDKNENIINLDKFKFNVNSKIVEASNIDLKDNEGNNIKIDKGQINLANRNVVGKDVKVLFNKSIFGNKKNDPRIYGKSIISNTNETSIHKGVFTSCQFKERDKCPPWIIKAKEVKHNKTKKTIEYKNAWLSIYDQPVVYFPYFFHPDPTVKRQSGFLMPKFNNSNFLGSSVQIPYYNVVSDNKDFTLTPRIFFNEKILMKSEYRQKNKYSDVIFDHSFIRNDGNTTSHFFANYNKNIEENNFEINIETTSNKNYLKKYEIESLLVDSFSTLNSYINFEDAEYDTYFTSSIEVFEDLSKKSSDSYEFIYPSYQFIKNFNTSSEGDLSFSTLGHQKKYETNRYDAIVVNDLTFKSSSKILKNGFVGDYSYQFRNINTDGNNSTEYKNYNDHKLLSKIMINSKYPLIKKNNGKTKYLTPLISARFSPSETKNVTLKDKRVEYLNLFDLDRLKYNDMIEGGESLTLGADYKIINDIGNELFSLSAGQIFRLNENNDLPLNSSIGQERSDIIGNIKYSPNEIINLKYSFSFDNDLNNSTYNFTEANLSFNNFFTSFKFLEISNILDETSYLSNTSKIDINDAHSIKFDTNKNLDINLTEYYDLIYEYKNDCLTAAVEYRKKYYKDEDLSPEENIFFIIKLLPFGAINSPNIN